MRIDCLLKSIKLSSSVTMRSYSQSKERLKIDSVSHKNEPCSKMRGKGTKSTRMTRLRTGLTCASSPLLTWWKESAFKKCNWKSAVMSRNAWVCLRTDGDQWRMLRRSIRRQLICSIKYRLTWAFRWTKTWSLRPRKIKIGETWKRLTKERDRRLLWLSVGSKWLISIRRIVRGRLRRRIWARSKEWMISESMRRWCWSRIRWDNSRFWSRKHGSRPASKS